MIAHRELSAEEYSSLSQVFATAIDGGLQDVRRFVDPALRKVYDVFLLNESLVLKKEEGDQEIYDRYFRGHGFAVPAVCGCFMAGESRWVTMPYIPGDDARSCTAQSANRIGRELARIQGCYLAPGGHSPASDGYFSARILEAWDKARRRLPEHEDIFRFVRERFFSAPHSLIHDDLLPINVLLDDGKPWIIDWTYADILPYFLDLARFAFITNEAGEFYIPAEAASSFLEAYYHGMCCNSAFKVDWKQFLCDAAISAFCQYSEFVSFEAENAQTEDSQNLTFLKMILEYLEHSAVTQGFRPDEG